MEINPRIFLDTYKDPVSLAKLMFFKIKLENYKKAHEIYKVLDFTDGCLEYLLNDYFTEFRGELEIFEKSGDSLEKEDIINLSRINYLKTMKECDICYDDEDKAKYQCINCVHAWCGECAEKLDFCPFCNAIVIFEEEEVEEEEEKSVIERFLCFLRITK